LDELVMRRCVRLNSFKAWRAGMTVEAVLVVESYPGFEWFSIGAGGIAGQMPEAGHLSFEASTETVIAMTVKALVLSNPCVLIMARRKGPALGIFHVVG